MTPEEQDQVERIRAKLYDFVSNNPGHVDSDQARRILGKLPGRSPSDAMAPRARELTDEQAGTANPPETERLMTLTGRPGSTPIAAMGPRKFHTTTELEGDPGAQEIVKNAELAGPMMLLGRLGLNAGGRIGAAIMNSRGGQAAARIANSGGGGTVTELAPEAEAQLDQIRRLRSAAPERAPMLDRQEESILERGIKPDPQMDADRELLKFKGPHGSDLGLGGGAAMLLHGHVPTGVMALPELALMAMRNAAPIAGRLASPAGRAVGRGIQAMIPATTPIDAALIDKLGE